MSKSGADSYNRLVKELAISKLKKREAGSRRQRQDRQEVLYSFEREFVKKAVLEHSSVLKQKFPDVDLNDVIISTQLILRKVLDKYIDGKKYEWFDSSREIILAKNFRVIQDLMTQIKKDLRQQARDSINATANKLVQEEQVQTALVISGTDVRDVESGGDLVKEDLANGIIVASANKLRNVAQKFDPQRGTEVGHTFTIALGNIKAITQTNLIGLFTPLVQARLFQIEQHAEKADANLEANYRLLKKSGKKEGKITITIIESAETNSKEGGEVDLKEFRLIIESNLNRIFNEIKGSPTLAERYERGIIELFTTGKVKKSTTNFSVKTKARVKRKRKVKVYGPKLTSAKTSQAKKSKTTSTNLRKLIDLINRKFHDKIRENMGKGRSKKILNYRTGRFAKSAKLQELLPSREKNAINATVRYMRKPYGVFEPGASHLALPGRNPARIFGRSIRQILQEEKIAKLRRVKVTLRG
jgi:hypothetical protein